jgi:magnesium transporter
MSRQAGNHGIFERMSSLVKKRRSALGQPPGTLIHVGEEKARAVKLTVINYNEDGCTEQVIDSVEESYPYIERPSITWLNIDGLHDVELFNKLGEHFNIHPLVLEDILNTEQRPKLEDFDHYLYIIVKMITYDNEKDSIELEQVSMILGPSFVISFQEKEGDVFDIVRDRIKKRKGRICKMGADYLAYSLIDTIVDNYFLVMERIGERIGFLEDQLLEDPDSNVSHKLHALKRELLYLRNSVWPLREISNGLGRVDSDLVHKSTGIFLRDLYDHSVQVLDSVEIFREMLTGLLDTYLTSLSTKMNYTIKVLTIFATIFIPLTFITGVYGMNFKFMPELSWRWGYPTVWGVMVTAATFMIVYFKKKKWF